MIPAHSRQRPLLHSATLLRRLRFTAIQWLTPAQYLLRQQVYSSLQSCHTATKTHMPHGITQCYLPSGRGDIPALIPAEAGTRLSDPGGMQGWVDLVGWLHTEMVYPPEDGHPSRYWLDPMWINFVHATNIANHYAMQPTYYNLSVSILYQSYCEYYETRKGRKAEGKSQPGN